MATGENEQGLRKIMDFTRMLSLAILTIHIYLLCYSTFKDWQITSSITDRILTLVAKMSVFSAPLKAKAASLLLLIISLFATKGRKDEKVKPQNALSYVFIGLALFTGSVFLVWNLYLLSFIVLMLPGCHSDQG